MRRRAPSLSSTPRAGSRRWAVPRARPTRCGWRTRTTTRCALWRFRAAAVDQLRVWAQRAGVPLYEGKDKQDPASLVYESYARAKAEGIQLMLVDTAGRLHTKQDLMESLGKMVRVMKKQDDTAPHEVILVLDATTGQAAHTQAKLFKDHAGITGLIVTKLDGTARGGVVVALSSDYALPVFMIGVGEALEDLQPFDPKEYAEALI